MKTPALFGSLLLTLAALASTPPAPVEPPALTAKQLQERSTLIVVATVTEVWTAKVGRETLHRAELRVHKVERSPKDRLKDREDAKTRQAEKKEEKAKPKLQDEKLKLRDPKEKDEPKPVEKTPDPSKLAEQDKLKTGDAITVNWVTRELKPGETGSSGQAASFIRPGQTVRAHVDGDYDLLSPNGIALADPVYAAEDLLKSRDLTRLRDGATKATGIGAHDEAAKLWEQAVAFQDLAAPDHRFYWASALAAGRRYVEAAQVLMPLATHPKDESNAGKKKGDAKRLVLAHLWACGDNQAYLAGFTQIAKADNDAATWDALVQAADNLHDSDTARLAEEGLKKAGGKPEEPKKTEDGKKPKPAR